MAGNAEEEEEVSYPSTPDSWCERNSFTENRVKGTIQGVGGLGWGVGGRIGMQKQRENVRGWDRG